MPDTAYYFLTIAISLASFFGGVWAGRRSRGAALALFAAAVCALCFKAILNHRPALEARLFPWEDYLFFQGYLLFPPALLGFGLATGLLRGRNRRACAAFAALLFAISLVTERWMLVEHELPDTGRVVDAHHHLPQSTGYSCAPACCVMLLSYWNVAATEPEMARLCRTLPNTGTTFFNLYRGLRLKLTNSPYRVLLVDETAAELRSRGVPAILMDGRTHAVCVAFTDGGVVLHDPLVPHHRPMSFAEFEDEHSGPAVVVVRPGSGSANGRR